MANKNKKIVKRLADVDTGEFIEIYEGDTIKIVSGEQTKTIQKSRREKELNEEMKVWNKELGGFIFLLFKYCDLTLEENNNTTPEDITKIFYLATYVNYEGYLIYEKEYMTKNKMCELLKISRRRFDTFFKKMKDNDIFIYENKTTKINKEYFIKGKMSKETKLNSDYSRLYINTIRQLYENVSVSKHRQLGMYFKIIPYIHRQRSVICHNPDSREDEVELMTVRELKDKIGYHRNGIRKFIDDLFSIKLETGESILVTIRGDKDEGKSLMIINPRVFYGGNFNIPEGKWGILKFFKVL